MLGIVRPTDRHGLHGGHRRDQSRLDPPYGTLPRSPLPEMRVGADIVRKKTLLGRPDRRRIRVVIHRQAVAGKGHRHGVIEAGNDQFQHEFVQRCGA